MEYKLPPLPKTITMLSDMQSGTMEVVHIDTLRQYAEQAVAPLLAEIERLEKLCQEKYNQGYDEGHEAGWDICSELSRD